MTSEQQWRARAEALKLALDDARARTGAEQLAGLDGVVGPLLELVEVAPGWERAAAAAGRGAARRGGRRRRCRAPGRRALQPRRRPALLLVLDAPADARRRRRRARTRSGHPRGSPTSCGRRRRRSSTASSTRCCAAWSCGRRRLGRGLDVALARPDLIVVTAAGDRFARRGAWRAGAAGDRPSPAPPSRRPRPSRPGAGRGGGARRRLTEAQLAAPGAPRPTSDARPRPLEANDDRLARPAAASSAWPPSSARGADREAATGDAARRARGRGSAATRPASPS